MTGARWTVGIGLLAAALLLSGCSDDGGGQRSDPTLTPTSEATSTTPAASVPPFVPEAEAYTSEGASAFVHHWFALATYGYASGDAEPLLAVSSPACETCSNVASTIRTAYDAGGRLEGGEITVVSAATPGLVAGQPTPVTVTIRQAEMREIDAAGEIVSTSPAESLAMGAVLERADDGWEMHALATDDR